MTKMPQWLKQIRHALNRPKPPQPPQPDSRAGPTHVDLPAIRITAAKLSDTADRQSPPLHCDLWKSAYDQLDRKEREILFEVQSTTRLEDNVKNRSQTVALIDNVIQITEEQYKEYQQKGIKISRSTGEDIDLRKLSRKILNAALSFKDVVNTVVSFDPTHHAASAWAVVSLGLSMTQNRVDLQDALFESAEFLAEVLSGCAYIETTFYHNDPIASSNIETAIVRIYRAILRFAAEMLAVQNARIARRLMHAVTPITDQRLTDLRSSVEIEWQKLCKWVEVVALDKVLQNGTQAELRLANIDEQVAKVLRVLAHSFCLPVAEGAYYNSYENQGDDTCLPNTRVDLLSQISNWAGSCESKHMFWLNGMAGTGKSTIARTVARSLDEEGKLGASFFFKRGEGDRANARRLISTITKELITKVPQLVPGVLAAIDRDPDISSKALSQQFDALLLHPLLALKTLRNINKVVVIDALDECVPEDIQILLKLLPLLQKSTSIHLRIFLTSRPELPIRLGFKQSHDHHCLVLHELPSPVIEHDIRLFMRVRLSDIRADNSLPPDWPSDDEMEKLVALSIPLFIYAATVCRFIGDGKRSPTKRLAAVLQSEAAKPTSQMERVYLPVLLQILDDEDPKESQQLVKEFQDIVGVIVFLATPLSVHTLGQLLSTTVGDIRNLLNKLHSVLAVPEDINAPVRTLHLSFHEFLLNTKEEAFHVNEEVTHGRILSHCLRVMRSGLKHNICALSRYGTLREDVASQVIDQHIPQALQYSCRYWTYHLEQAGTQKWEQEISSFLNECFIHWVEAMSLMGLASETIGIISALQSRSANNSDVMFFDFLHDAYRFLLKTVQIINTAPLQLYCSAFAFSPTGSIIRKRFQDQRPTWIPVLPKLQESWSSELQALEGHSDCVNSAVFSPDGRSIVSGSDDHTIKLWDAQTGAELRTLEGHSDCVNSAVFSPDGRSIVSGSYDKTIKLWDAQTGAELRTLEGHSDCVNSAIFSPDGRSIVSGSYDHTIKIWDVQTGAGLWTLEGHADYVISVAFSPDGQRIVSGSRDLTIKLWDAQTGAELQTLEGHSEQVTSVAFSPDGLKIVSGSCDLTIKLWDAHTGAELQTLEGHSNWINSAVFSPDSESIVSGSYDHTIKIWDVQTGTELQTLEGHSHFVKFVAFLGDGQRIVSASCDHTIRLWDIQAGAKLRPFEGHSDRVNSVAFSPDGLRIVSGSGDNKIKIWDAQTGAELRTLEGHSNWIKAAVFSPDGESIVSGSDDYTIKLWDALTGAELRALKGHTDCINSVAFSPEGQRIVSGSEDHIIKVWDIQTGAELRTLEGHSGPVMSVAFSPDGQRIVSGSYDRTVKLWDAQLGAELQTLVGHPIWVMSVSFSLDGQRIVSSSHDKTLKIWDAQTGANLRTLDGHFASVSNDTVDDAHTEHEQRSQISIESSWICLGSERVIWLPPELRGPRCHAIKHGILAMGYLNGLVLIVRLFTPLD